MINIYIVIFRFHLLKNKLEVNYFVNFFIYLKKLFFIYECQIIYISFFIKY